MQNKDAKSNNIFKQIFIDHWESFKRHYPWYDTKHINTLVTKMLNCGNPKHMGYAEYRCPECGKDSKVVSLSCKGCLCLSCGKGHTDKWVEQVCNSLIHGMCYRHIVLTMPTLLCEICRRNKILLNHLPRYGAECLKKFYNSIKRKELKSGFIVVLQTHGRNGSYNVHLHVIATSGGLDNENKWHEIKYFPYEQLHRIWQKYLLKMLSDVLGDEAKAHIDSFQKEYPNGFVGNIDTKNHLSGYEVPATYLAKYVVAPPISLRRILSYDGSKVEYIYKSHRTERMELEKVYAFDFIERMIQHIMPPDFERIRYYGIHLPAKLKKVGRTVETAIRRTGRIIKNTVKVIFSPNYRYRVKESTGVDPMICRYCQAEMELWIMYHPKYGIFYEGYDDYNKDLEKLKIEIEKIVNPENNRELCRKVFSVIKKYETKYDDHTRFIICLNESRKKHSQSKRDKKLKAFDDELKKIFELKSKDNKAINYERIINKLFDGYNRQYKKFFTFSQGKNENTTGYKKDIDRLKYEERFDGVFIITSNRYDLTPAEIIKSYKNLQEVESLFDDLKHFVDVRPVRHWLCERVEAHVFICILALLLKRVFEIEFLKGKSVTEPLEKIAKAKIVRVKMPKLSKPDEYSEFPKITDITPEQKKYFEMLKIKNPMDIGNFVW